MNIRAKAICFFEKQFSEMAQMEEKGMIDIIPKLITPDQNTAMGRIPTLEEVKVVVFNLSGDS